MKEPWDWDEYAQCFFPKAEELARRASEAEQAGEKEKATELYLLVTAFLLQEQFHSYLVGGALPSGASHDFLLQDQKSKGMLGKRAKRSSTRVPRKAQCRMLE
jgi:hypothetical protein